MQTLELGEPASSAALREIALKLRASKKTVFVAGAGISCNAGIPDFRSKDGLYALVKRQNQDALVKGKDLFDTILFRDTRSTEIFYSFMAGLRDATVGAEPTATHHLLKILKDKKKLLRCYTQNIDGLEFRAGLGTAETVQLHGDIHQLKCMHCAQAYDWSPEYAREMQDGDAPQCMNCVNSSLARQLSGKRSTAIGQLRPNIVLYGEDHPSGDEIALTLRKDCSRSPQLLIVAGTSLKVIGIKRLVKTLAQATHAAGGMVVFVNKTPASKSEWDQVFDFQVLADTDAWVSEMRRQIPSFFERQTKLAVKRKAPQTQAVPESVDLQQVLVKNGIVAQQAGSQNVEPQVKAEGVPQDTTKQDTTKLGQDTTKHVQDTTTHVQGTNEHAQSIDTSMLVRGTNILQETGKPVRNSPDLSPESAHTDTSFMGAKRTKSDPYAETVQQNMLLRSPTSERSFASELSQDVLSSPATEILDLHDDIPSLKLEHLP